MLSNASFSSISFQCRHLLLFFGVNRSKEAEIGSKHWILMLTRGSWSAWKPFFETASQCLPPSSPGRTHPQSAAHKTMRSGGCSLSLPHSTELLQRDEWLHASQLEFPAGISLNRAGISKGWSVKWF